MTTQTNSALRGTGEHRRSPGIHHSVTEMRQERGITRWAIYDRRGPTAPNPLVQLGGDR
jgi:hypothetical protein